MNDIERAIAEEERALRHHNAVKRALLDLMPDDEVTGTPNETILALDAIFREWEVSDKKREGGRQSGISRTEQSAQTRTRVLRTAEQLTNAGMERQYLVSALSLRFGSVSPSTIRRWLKPFHEQC